MNATFIYAKNKVVKALSLEDVQSAPLDESWRHVATLDPNTFIEHLCNRCTDWQVLESIQELKK